MKLNDLAVRTIMHGRIVTNRMSGYTTPYSFLMLYYLYACKILDGASLQWIGQYLPGNLWIYRYALIIVPIIVLIIIIPWDIKHVLPAEQVYYSNSNPEWRKVRDAVCNKEDKDDKL